MVKADFLHVDVEVKNGTNKKNVISLCAKEYAKEEYVKFEAAS